MLRQECREARKNVGNVQVTERTLRCWPSSLPNDRHQQRECRSHAGAPRHKGDGNPDTHDDVIARGLPGSKATHVLEEQATELQLERNRQRRDSNQQFGNGIEAQGATAIGGQDPGGSILPHPRSQAQTGHKHRNDYGSKGRRYPHSWPSRVEATRPHTPGRKIRTQQKSQSTNANKILKYRVRRCSIHSASERQPYLPPQFNVPSRNYNPEPPRFQHSR